MLSDQQVRQEIWQTAMQSEGNPSYLAGFLLASGSLSLGKNPEICLELRHSQSGMVVAAFLESMYGYRCEISLDAMPERKNRVLRIELPDRLSDRILTDCHMKQYKDGQALYTLSIGSMRWVNPACFFAALFLEIGVLYVSNEYRLDLVLPPDHKRLGEIEAMLGKKDIRFLYKLTGERLRLSFRKEDIASFLALVGAPESSLEVTQFYFERNVNRAVNRQINCSTNNMDKAYTAASEQAVAIAFLKENRLYQTLPPAVQEAGEMRTNLPNAPLQELALRLGVSKVTVHRRLQRIVEFAKEKGGK